jgi:hypothetical protein
MSDFSAAQTAPISGAFSIGGCLKRALSTFFANFISFNLLGLVVIVPGILLVVVLFGAVFASIFMAGSAVDGTPPDFGALHFGTFGLVWVLMVTLQYFLTAVIVFGSLRYLQGNKAGFLACLMQGLRRIVPIIGVAVITTVLVTIGMALLIVPGIIIAVMICLAIPVLMVESPGIMGSLSRSRALTKGYRWHIFGVLLLAFVITTIVNIVVPIPFGLVLPQELTIIVNGLLQLFTTVFMAVLLAVIYHDLRVAKEGVSTAQLAAVFD